MEVPSKFHLKYEWICDLIYFGGEKLQINLQIMTNYLIVEEKVLNDNQERCKNLA